MALDCRPSYFRAAISSLSDLLARSNSWIAASSSGEDASEVFAGTICTTLLESGLSGSIVFDGVVDEFSKCDGIQQPFQFAGV